MIVDVLDDDVEESGCLLGGAAEVPGLEDQGVALPLLPVQRHAGGDQAWQQRHVDQSEASIQVT